MPDELIHENIVCFAGEDWWFHNPHSNYHLMKHFAGKNRVLFVNSIGIRMPSLQNDKFFWKRITNKLKSMARYLKKAGENLYVFTPFAFPPFRGMEKPVERLNGVLLALQLGVVLRLLKMKQPILWVTSPTAKNIALDLRKKYAKLLVYYCVDNVSLFPGVNREYLYSLETELHRRADLAFFVNHKLLKERKDLNPNTRYLGHGVDYEHFARSAEQDLPAPVDLKDIPRPIVGYMGEIQSADMDLIRYLSEKNSALSFVFVGEVYDDVSGKKLPANVYFLGKRPYEALPAYLRQMACLCLYYRTDDDYNCYRNPKKLLEYLATGKPIISVPIYEMEYFKETIWVAKDKEEFSGLIQRAIKDEDPVFRWKRMTLAQSHTWEAVSVAASRDILEALSGQRGAALS